MNIILAGIKVDTILRKLQRCEKGWLEIAWIWLCRGNVLRLTNYHMLFIKINVTELRVPLLFSSCLPTVWMYTCMMYLQHVLRELPSSPVPASCCTALLEAFRKCSIHVNLNMLPWLWRVLCRLVLFELNNCITRGVVFMYIFPSCSQHAPVMANAYCHRFL